MIGIYGNKQTMPESQKKELFSAGITYMVSGEYAFAFSCFTQAGKSDLPTLYNKALCCYYLSLYNDCRSLLLEAERLLPPCVHGRARPLASEQLYSVSTFRSSFSHSRSSMVDW